MDKKYSALQIAFNFAVFPFVIFLLAFNVNSFNGIIDTLESGQYLSCVNAVFHGGIPYRDFIPPVGPLFIWILSLALLALGKTIYALRLYFVIATVGAYVILYFLGRSIYRLKFSGYILPVIALVETFNPFWASRWAGYSRMGAGLCGLFLQVLYVKKNNPWYLFFAGSGAAFALLYGIDSGIFLMICGILLCFLTVFNQAGGPGKNIPDIIRRGLIFFSGTAVILIPFMLYMAFNRALLPYLEGTYLIMRYHIPAWQTSYPSFMQAFTLHGNNPWLFFISDDFRIYMPVFFYSLALIYSVYAVIKQRGTIDSVVMPLIAVYGILSYKSGLRVVRDTQLDAGLLPLLLLSVYFTEKGLIFLLANIKSFMRWRELRKITLPLMSAIVSVALIFTYIAASRKRVYDTWPGWLQYQRNKAKIIPVYTFLKKKDGIAMDPTGIGGVGPILVNEEQLAEIEGVTEYIKSRTSGNEPVFTFPEHGLYNFLADRPTAGRFYIAVYAHTCAEWREELLSDLKRTLPRYIVYSRRLSNIAKNINRDSELLPEVRNFILGNYGLEKEFGVIGIYRLERES